MSATNPAEAAPGGGFDLLRRATQKMMYNRYVGVFILSSLQPDLRSGLVWAVEGSSLPCHAKAANPQAYETLQSRTPIYPIGTIVASRSIVHTTRRYATLHCSVRCICHCQVAVRVSQSRFLSGPFLQLVSVGLDWAVARTSGSPSQTGRQTGQAAALPT